MPEQSASDDVSSASATIWGFGAVLLWGALASLTALAGTIPPFQMAAMTFAVGSCVGLAWAYMRGQSLSVLRTVPPGAWALGIYGLLTFHVCYFFALQQAPPLEASLIIYLWPLLIVILSGFLPAHLGGRGLKWWHLVGALLGLAGTVLILLGPQGRIALQGNAAGYAMAAAAALIWSSYSVGSRVFSHVPSAAVIGSCIATAIGATLLHIALEQTVWPHGTTAWLAVLGLGLGPVGLAFYLWDEGMKRGDIRLLGVASYATPLVSTVLLTALGLGTASPSVWIAAILISGGALLASRDALTASAK